LEEKVLNNITRKKQYRYPWPVIEFAVQLYSEDEKTFRIVADELREHGVDVSHKTVYEWVTKFSDDVELRKRRKITGFDVEEVFIKCNGVWKYMYRAVDKRKRTLSVLLRDSKSLAVAKNFFKKKLK
jgi:putative transposase